MEPQSAKTTWPAAFGPEAFTGSFLEQARQFAEQWTGFAAKMAAAGMTFDPRSAPPEIARQMRGAGFQALSQYAQEFMRSPEFLGLMKQSLDASLTFRQQLNEFLTNLHHGAQGVARQDIDSLMLSVRHMETRVLDRMEELSGRLDNISQRLDALEGGPSDGEGAKPSKRQSKRDKEG
jgi:hypothetical protein